MQSHCQHNLYICHCSPSSQDPSPIHPLTTTHQTTTLHRFPAKRNGNVNKQLTIGRSTAAKNNSNSALTGNGDLVKHKYTVSHSSVAVMTSPTLNNGNNVTSNNVNVLENNVKNNNGSELMDSISPSTASSCSSIPNAAVMTSQHNNGTLRNGSLGRYSQSYGKIHLIF